MKVIQSVYNFLWGDILTIPLPGGVTLGLPLLVLILVPVSVYFTIRTRFILIRRFPHMLRITVEKKTDTHKGSI